MVDAWPEGVERIVLDEVASTNDYAVSLASERSGPAWVMAHMQTGSKGRRGRPWVFHRGNFAASYLMWPEAPLPQIAQMSFVAALALLETISSFAPKAPLQLKWPNDLLLAGQKVSGILLESIKANDKTGLVIGIGVNLVHAPLADEIEDHAVPATSLTASGINPIDPEVFLDALARDMAAWQEIWTRDGFEPIRDAWRSKSIGIGQSIVARLPGQTLTGVFEDIDGTGCLILQTEDGRKILPAADVFFPEPD